MDLIIRPTRDDEKSVLEPFDNTKLTAINTCPTWGIIRYGHHKAWPSTYDRSDKSAALNAGSAAHEVFAACRVWRLYHTQGQKDLALSAGLRIFGAGRWETMVPLLTEQGTDRQAYLTFCLEALYSFGLVDDPDNKRKGISSIEEACILYLDRIDTDLPIYHNDNGFVGIEQPFDLIIEFTTRRNTQRTFRFTGKIDGVETHDGTPWLHENKTASRLNEAWIASFQLAHQITGYSVAASFLCGSPLRNARIHGLSIPLPRSYDFGGFVTEDVERKAHHIIQWCEWVDHTLTIYDEYKDNPQGAPKYTHSCNRYFRPCTMIPYCSGDDEQKAEVWDLLVDDEWSPLHETKEATNG